MKAPFETVGGGSSQGISRQRGGSPYAGGNHMSRKRGFSFSTSTEITIVYTLSWPPRGPDEKGGDLSDLTSTTSTMKLERSALHLVRGGPRSSSDVGSTPPEWSQYTRVQSSQSEVFRAFENNGSSCFTEVRFAVSSRFRRRRR